MRIVFLVLSLLMPIRYVWAQAKDTIREAIDYRSSNYSKANRKEANAPTADWLDNKVRGHYWGLQINQLLQQAFNFSGSNRPSENPYVLTYAFNSTRGGGISFGLGYQSGTTEDFNLGQKRSTKSSDINFRMGYEKKTLFGKRWLLGRGVDFLLNRSVDNTDVDNGGLDSESKTNGWGLGPRMSLSYGFTPQIFVGTELSWYIRQWNTAVNFPSVPNSSSDLKEKSFNLQMPTAIFLTMRF